MSPTLWYYSNQNLKKVNLTIAINKLYDSNIKMEESERLRISSSMNKKPCKIIWIIFCMLFVCTDAGKKFYVQN